MNWTEPAPGKEGVSYYDHTICETPLGKMIIEWKSWKDQPSYDIQLDDEWVGVEYTLEEAKLVGKEYLKAKSNDLIKFLAQDLTTI